ncbi:MAG: hypothetical protein SNJ58_11395 [Aggregatilineales bacterium]
MDISLVMDQILENTSLLANLGDAEANYLLGWTREVLPGLVGEIADEALGWQKVEALKETLRAANALIARLRTASEPTLLALVQAFLRQYAITFEQADASNHPIVPELAGIMRAQPDNLAALRALLDFAQNLDSGDDEPLTPAQAQALQNVEESLSLLRSTLNDLADSLSAFLPAQQLSELRSQIEALGTPEDDEQEEVDES